MTGLLDFIREIAARLVALFVGVLPARYWSRFDRLPVAAMTIPSAILTGIAGFWLQWVAFLSYAHRASAALESGVAKITQRQLQGEFPGTELILEPQRQVLGLPTLVAALLFTPLGLFATYVVLSAFVRAAANIVGDPWGDPALTGFDALVRRTATRLTRNAQARRRIRQEGPDVPDRLVPGAFVGAVAADYVVLAARRKPEWTAGAIVMTPSGWFRLQDPFDIEFPEGLRTAYPLCAMHTVEVVRRGITYELPPLDPPLKPSAK